MEKKKQTFKQYSPEFKERAVRMVSEHQSEHESQWAALRSIASKVGCTAETLRCWMRQHERDLGLRSGATTEERERVKALEREIRELPLQHDSRKIASDKFGAVQVTGGDKMVVKAVLVMDQLVNMRIKT